MSGNSTATGTGQIGTRSFDVGVTTITYTVTDAVGNTNTNPNVFTVTVIDDEDPLITCPADITVSADSNCEVATLYLGIATTSDNCGVASVVNGYRKD